jgi:serine/threonine-protein kinase
MHQHLRQPLVPADHVNTALSAGVGEIIDVAMAKKREERYASTEDLLEDLRLVRNNEPPKHARRPVDLESLAKIEETGKTVDLVPNLPPQVETFKSPLMLILALFAGLSMLINIVLIIVLLVRHG